MTISCDPFRHFTGRLMVLSILDLTFLGSSNLAGICGGEVSSCPGPWCLSPSRLGRPSLWRTRADLFAEEGVRRQCRCTPQSGYYYLLALLVCGVGGQPQQAGRGSHSRRLCHLACPNDRRRPTNVESHPEVIWRRGNSFSKFFLSPRGRGYFLNPKIFLGVPGKFARATL